MNLNKYFPFVFIYFFLNTVALPFGLTWMSLLAPFFYIWILVIRKKEILLPFLAILLPFVIVHLLAGVDNNAYAISILNLVMVYIFSQAACTFFKVCKDPEKIFRWILKLNFIFCLIALAIYFTPFYGFLWTEQTITEGVNDFKRLKLLTYEPSYYALLLIPVFFYFLLQYFFQQNSVKTIYLLPMLLLPYILSFSIGVCSAVLASLFITWIIYFKRLTKKRRVFNSIINIGAGLGFTMAALLVFFRNNPLFLRFLNIVTGKDSSANGRTVDAFIIAQKLLKDGNEYFGIGLGQIKIAGEEVIRNYYLYYNEVRVAIPNASAETLATFGWFGLSLRIAIEIFLFFYTKAWNNYYNLLLFIFMFIYQFTGSFITNGSEYVIWILAFTKLFPQFNVRSNEDVRRD